MNLSWYNYNYKIIVSYVMWFMQPWNCNWHPHPGRVPAVGVDVATVIENLRVHGGLNLDRLHLIGHSLGAHVSGFAGKHFNGSIAQITG